MKHFIITGTSRGIGRSIVEKLASPQHTIHCISRERSVNLINNASVVAPVAFIDTANVNDISGNIKVNLLAPIILSSLFIKYTTKLITEKRLLNISSSSAKYHHPGMSMYSAAKAGIMKIIP